MHTSQPTLIPLRKLRVLPNNPRKITQERLNQLCDSIRQNGFYQHRPLAVEPIPDTDEYYVLDGNQRKKALARMKRKEALCVIYTDLTEEERARIILMGNISAGEWDMPVLQTDFAPIVELSEIGLEIDMPELEISDGGNAGDTPPADDGETDTDAPDTDPDTREADDEGKRLSFYFRMLGDFIYPSDNEFDIPVLLKDNMPLHPELPLAPWGAEARYKKGITTYHFYVDDYRFEALFKDPIKLLQSGCRAIVEPNCSIHDQTPMAYAIFQTYRKRYLCRYLQECGLQVWVDLNVSPHFEAINALGVPQGYNAFCTRGVSGWLETTERHYAMAQRISGLDKPNLFVYGGGQDVIDWCREHEVIHVKEYVNRTTRRDRIADGKERIESTE